MSPTGNKGFDAVAVAEHDEPPAIYRQRSAAARLSRRLSQDMLRAGRELKDAIHHEGNVLDVQLRGEYLYAATGKGGFRIYDVANIDNKGFSERTVTAPVSPMGQRFYVKTKYATAVASPSTLAVDPAAHAASGKRRAADPPIYGISLRRGQIRRPGRRRRSQSQR